MKLCPCCGKPVRPKHLDSLGTALKPAFEPVIWAQRPMDQPTICANVCEHGTGAINVGGCRVGCDVAEFYSSTGKPRSGAGHAHGYGMGDGYGGENANPPDVAGRWPPNCALVHSAACKRVGVREVRAGDPDRFKGCRVFAGQTYAIDNHSLHMKRDRATGNPSGLESVPAYECAPDCPVAELGRQSGESVSAGGGGFREAGADTKRGIYGRYGDRNLPNNVGKGDSGNASRFFPQFEWQEDDFWPFQYVAKASRAEREQGCDNLPAATAGEATGGRAEGSDGLKSPRAGSGRTGGANGMGVRNAHPT